jgi:hypothetical protein
MEGKVVYFTKPGPENTEAVLQAVRRRAEELGRKNILVASTTGNTAVRATEVFAGMRVVTVSHNTSFQQPNVQEFTEDNRQKVENAGATVFTTIHAFAGVDRAMRDKFNMYLLGATIANTLRIFGQGMKVACEIALMAADAGLVRTDEDIIAVGGTSRGADIALVLRPVNTADFFDLRIKEILCKPRF